MSNSSFVPFLIARACVASALSMLTVAVGWHIYLLTGDPFDLALIGLVQIIPVIALFMITGIVIDSFPRRLVLLSCVAAQVIVLAWLAWTMNQATIDKYLVLFQLFLMGSIRAFYQPAREAILPNIVSKDFFPKAVSINSVVWNFAATAGPFLGGLFINWFDLAAYWYITALSLIGFIMYLFLPKLNHLKPTGNKWQQVVGGIQFVRNNPIVLGSISLDLFIILLGSVVALLPIYAADILKVGPDMLGLLRAMPALGAVMVGVVIARIDNLRQTGRLLFASLSIFVLSIFVFALSEHLWLSLIALWVYGGADMISVNVRQTLMQVATPNDLRGRVSAVNSLFIASSNQMGDFRAGAVASVFSPVTTVLLGGVAASAVVIAGYFLFPSIRKLDRLHDADVNHD